MTYWQHVKYCFVDAGIGAGLMVVVVAGCLLVRWVRKRRWRPSSASSASSDAGPKAHEE